MTKANRHSKYVCYILYCSSLNHANEHFITSIVNSRLPLFFIYFHLCFLWNYYFMIVRVKILHKILKKKYYGKEELLISFNWYDQSRSIVSIFLRNIFYSNYVHCPPFYINLVAKHSTANGPMSHVLYCSTLKSLVFCSSQTPTTRFLMASVRIHYWLSVIWMTLYAGVRSSFSFSIQV